MSIAATPVPMTEAKARLAELAKRVRQQHERIALMHKGEVEAVMLSADDLEGLEMSLESSVTPRARCGSRRAWQP
jgi:antitoxin YefM